MITKALALYCFAATLNGATWWAYFMAQAQARHATAGVPTWTELIQLGGTGGLIVSLLGAVVMLWRERQELKAEFRNERASLLEQMGHMRADHAAYIDKLQRQHQEELQAMTDEYTRELKRQIEQLRADTASRLAEERAESNDKYEQK